jgi:hypothetical protein
MSFKRGFAFLVKKENREVRRDKSLFRYCMVFLFACCKGTQL